MSQESNFDGKKIITYVQCTGVWIESQDYGSKMNDFNHRLYESQSSVDTDFYQVLTLKCAS